MASQELEMMIKSFVDKAVKFVEESTTLKEQLRCFACCYVLLPHSTLFSAFMIWFLYFSITIVFTFVRDQLNISPAGWKETCTLKKYWIVTKIITEEEFGFEIEDLLASLRDIVQHKAPRLLELYDLVVTWVNSDAVNKYAAMQVKLNDAREEVLILTKLLEESRVETEDLKKASREDVLLLTEQLEKSRVKIEDMKKKADKLCRAMGFHATEAFKFKGLLDESRGMETEMMARNDKVHKRLSASKAECNQLLVSLKDASERNKDLKEQVDKLKFDKSELGKELDLMSIKKDDHLAEQHKLEISQLNKTIEKLETEKKELFASGTIDVRNADKFRALSFKYEEQIKELESENEDLHEGLSFEADTVDRLNEQLSKYIEQQKLMEAELKKTLEELETAKEDLHERLSFEGDTAVHLNAELSKYKEQNKLMETKMKETIEKLETEKEELHEMLSFEAGNNDLLDAELSEYRQQNKLMEAKLKKTIEELETTKDLSAELPKYKEQHKLMEAKMKGSREELQAKNKEFEMLSSSAREFLYLHEASLKEYKVEKDKLNTTISELGHEKNELNAKLDRLQVLLSEYKEANESLEQEKDVLLMNLRNANESAKFHKELLELDYAFV